MKISYNILKSFVEPPRDFSAKELADVLTMHTVEVEEVVDFKQRLKGAVVGLVTKVVAHPKADKLKLATVSIGQKSLEVVCGGVNLHEGMKVAFAQIGTLVRWHGEADWAPLEKAVIRGVESEGMACAAEELDIPDDNAVEHGIMDLSHLEAIPGTALSEALGLDDIVIDIDNKSITHRPDLWGHFGIARELAAIWQVPLKNPENLSIQSQHDIKLQVKITEPKYCKRYLGIVLTGLRPSPSPDWLQRKLLSLGMRPINNIVDVTNYVMLEYGQPLHAFDLAKLASPEIIVRTAKRNEKIVTIDGEEHKLDSDMLVIADTKKAVALAGVMGGQETEVDDKTESIVLESATFDGINIRQTASRLGVRTEASARFEKSLDPGIALIAARRAVELLCRVIPEAKIASELVDDYPEESESPTIMLNIPWLQARLGCDIPATEIINILERLGFGVSGSSPEVSVTVPSWRAARDITIPEDLMEEVARIYGYHKIPLVLPQFSIAPPARDLEQNLRWQIRDLLVSTGWAETLSYTFVGSEAGGKIELVNPVDKTKQFLRPSLLASFSEQFVNAKRSYSDKNSDKIRMFELGRVFEDVSGIYNVSVKGKSKLPAQPWHLILGVYENSSSGFRILKGVIELIETKTGLNFSPQYHELANGLVAEINIDGLVNQNQVQFKPLPKYPKMERDISMILPVGLKWVEVEAVVKKTSPLVEAVNVFDFYEVKNSLAFKIVFRASARTLKSTEVDEVMDKLTKNLQDQFNVTIR